MSSPSGLAHRGRRKMPPSIKNEKVVTIVPEAENPLGDALNML